MREYVVQAQANHAWVAWREGDVGRAEELARNVWDGWDGYMMQRVLAWEPVWPLLGTALRAGRDEEVRELVDVLLDPTRQAPPPELADALRSGAHEDACALAERYGYL